MNAIRVSKRAGLGLGILVTLFFLTLIWCRPALGGNVVITVTGTLNGARDDFQIFGMGRAIPKGTPYTLVFTFDDSKGQIAPPGCPGAGSKLVGFGASSPGTAVMTIGAHSFTFGQRPDSRSRVWRSTDSVCSRSEIGMAVQEGPWNLTTGVNILIRPNLGQKSLTQSGDWHGSLSLTDFDARNGDNAFAIRRTTNYGAETMSYLTVDKVVVGR